MNTVVEAWLWFLFLDKNSRTSIDVWAGALAWVKIHDWFCHKSVRFWWIGSRNRRIFKAYIQGSIPYWPYKLVARIQDAPRHYNRSKQWAKPSHLTEIDVLFSVLVLLDASIGMIRLWFQYHSHTPLIRHQLWPFWANLDHRWTSSTSPERWKCVYIPT